MKLRATLVQTDLVWESPTENRSVLEGLLSSLVGGTDLVVLPEMFTTGFSMDPQRLAEPWGGPTLTWMAGQARRLDAAVTGSLMTLENGRYYNRLAWVTPDGQVAFYDKRHLFRMGGEDLHYQAGEHAVVVSWRGFRFAPLICYDLRFPVWSRRREGFDYDVLLYVANWPAVRRHPWRSLLSARAIENLSYVIGVNRVGVDGNGVPHCGDSVAHDFKGEPLLEMQAQAAVRTVVLDRVALTAFRDRFPAHRDADQFTLRK